MPTRLDEIKNLHIEVHLGFVVGLPLPRTRRQVYDNRLTMEDATEALRGRVRPERWLWMRGLLTLTPNPPPNLVGVAFVVLQDVFVVDSASRMLRLGRKEGFGRRF